MSADRGGNNNIFSDSPVNWRSNTGLISGLQGIDDSQHLGSVASRRSRVGHDEPNLLLGVDDEDATDGEGGSQVLDLLSIDHVIQPGDLTALVGNHGKRAVRDGVHGGTHDLVDVAHPLLMVLKSVGREADELDVARIKFGTELGERAELSRAHRREIRWVAEEDTPGVADVAVQISQLIGGVGRVGDSLVEVDLAVGGQRGEVGRLGTNSQARLLFAQERGHRLIQMGAGHEGRARSHQEGLGGDAAGSRADESAEGGDEGGHCFDRN
jgi:hypothetical protein